MSSRQIVSGLLRAVGLGPKVQVQDFDSYRVLAGMRRCLADRDWVSVSNGLTNLPEDEYTLRIAALAGWTGLPQFLDAWVDAAPQLAEPWLVRGARKVDWAWDARGGGTADTVSDEDAARFESRLHSAESDLQAAATRAPDNPEPYNYLIRCSMGLGHEIDVLADRYEALSARAPCHFDGHGSMLTALTEKWGGSHEAMFALARQATAQAPEGNGIGALIPLAYIELWFWFEYFEEDRGARRHLRTKAALQEMHDAYRRSVGSPRFAPTSMATEQRGTFAMAFYLANQNDLAVTELRRMGNRCAASPWGYLARAPWEAWDPGYVVSRVRRKLGI